MNTAIRYSIVAVLSLILSLPVMRADAEDAGKAVYLKAERTSKLLLGDTQKQQYRHNWMNCIEKYKEVFTKTPDSPWAAAGMYKTGLLYHSLYKRSYLQSDLQEAVDTFERLTQQYPGSRYREKALAEIGKIGGNKAPISVAQKPYHKKRTVTKKKRAIPPPALPIVDRVAPPVENSVSEIQLPELPPAPRSDTTNMVTDFRFWSNPNYTRVVVDTDHEVTFSHHLLKKDPSLKKPQRLFIDLNQSKLSKELRQIVPIDDNLLENVRAGQYTSDTVRVVIDIKSFDNYKVFSLKNPFRIVIDVWGKGNAGLANSTPPPPAVPIKTEGKKTVSAIARQLALGVRRIVIDPGHGGKDYGAPGYLKGIHEKDIVLKIAKKLAAKIRSELNCEVILSRSSDVFLTLEERTAIANTQNADLFISLHTNASRDRRAYGIETYFLNLATDEDAIRVAAAENATSTKNISDLQSILQDLMQNAKINESTRLASRVQESMYNGLRNNYQQIKNKGVKQAPFYVLLGAQMPAILVETGFISHPRECKWLIDPNYQDRLCNSIVTGIRYYMRETNPTAFIERRPVDRSKG